MPARLITIPFSHYCEKARWALDRRGVDYQEEAHLPMLHTRHTRRLGGRSVPLLVIGGEGGPRVLADSTDILGYADEAGTRGAPLYPQDGGEVAALEDRFDEVLGPHARRLGYFGLLQDDRAMREVVRRASIPPWERAVGLPTLPVFKVLLRRGLEIDAASAARSEAKVRAVFDEVEARLADGRRFLCGDTFTAADLSFAALAMPLLVPPCYERWLLPLEETRAAFRSVVDRWRATPAGAFAMRVCATERQSPA